MNKIEKAATLYQESVLPYVAYLETKERNTLLKKLENNIEDSIVENWKLILSEKGFKANTVIASYKTYVEIVKSFNEEDMKKLKNKNTYFSRKHNESLKEQFEKTTVQTVPEEEEEEAEVELNKKFKAVKIETLSTIGSLLKHKNKRKKKEEKKKDKKKRVKKERNKKRKNKLA